MGRGEGIPCIKLHICSEKHKGFSPIVSKHSPQDCHLHGSSIRRNFKDFSEAFALHHHAAAILLYAAAQSSISRSEVLSSEFSFCPHIRPSFCGLFFSPFSQEVLLLSLFLKGKQLYLQKEKDCLDLKAEWKRRLCQLLGHYV